MATQLEVQMANEAFYEAIETGHVKKAEDAANSYTRTKLYEEGVFRKILPMQPIGNDELSQMIDTDSPVKIVEKQPESPVAASIPFGQTPSTFYIDGTKYAIGFSRIVSREMTKDVVTLRTWTMDIRQVLADIAIKQILAEEDSKWFKGTTNALIGANVPVPWSGVAQWITLSGGITRDTIMDSLKVMPSTDAHLESVMGVCNNITVKDFQKWGRDEMGGDTSQDILKNGFSQAEWIKNKWIVTIKRTLVPDGTVFYYADPAFIGKAYELEPATMFVKRERFLLQSGLYETIGAGIGFTGGLSRVDFLG